MHCPICRSPATRVVDSRVAADGMMIRRRRECERCRYRFSTIEEMELLDIVVVKHDGARESYSRIKLRDGILRSLTKRPYIQEQFDRLIHAIERDIQKKKKREVTSKEIGEVVMRHLSRFDTVAYIRFASIYRAFADVGKFESEIRALRKTKNTATASHRQPAGSRSGGDGRGPAQRREKHTNTQTQKHDNTKT